MLDTATCLLGYNRKAEYDCMLCRNLATHIDFHAVTDILHMQPGGWAVAEMLRTTDCTLRKLLNTSIECHAVTDILHAATWLLGCSRKDNNSLAARCAKIWTRVQPVLNATFDSDTPHCILAAGLQQEAKVH